MESKIEKKYIWHRIKRGQTLSRIAKRNGIESWKELYDFNKDLLKNPNLLIYIDEKEYDDGWCINNKQGILRIPIADHLNSQAQPEENEEWEKRFIRTFGYWGEEIKFIKQLLKERERWAIDTFLKDTASYNSFHNGRPRTMRNGLSGEGFEVRVSKLSKKK